MSLFAGSREEPQGMVGLVFCRQWQAVRAQHTLRQRHGPPSVATAKARLQQFTQRREGGERRSAAAMESGGTRAAGAVSEAQVTAQEQQRSVRAKSHV